VGPLLPGRRIEQPLCPVGPRGIPGYFRVLGGGKAQIRGHQFAKEGDSETNEKLGKRRGGERRTRVDAAPGRRDGRFCLGCLGYGRFCGPAEAAPVNKDWAA